MPMAEDILFPGASPPTNVAAVQTGPTSIRVTWTQPTPLDGITGYIISYTSDSDSGSGSVTVSGGSTVMETLTGLQNGETYTISIVATSDAGLPSASVMATDVDLGKSLNDSVPCTAIVMENEIHFQNVHWPKNDVEMEFFCMCHAIYYMYVLCVIRFQHSCMFEPCTC